MARHPRPGNRVTTHYHRTHPWFMAYAYGTALAAAWTIAAVWRVVT